MTTPGPERDEAFIEEEEEEAAEEASRIGGDAPRDTDDPAEQPLIESGEGEAEGFELAERDLEEIAEHGDEHRFPDSAVSDVDEERSSAEYGEPDEEIKPDE